MRKWLLIAAVALVIAVVPAAWAGVGCEEDSRSPEVYTFYGDSATVLSKVANVKMQLPERRMYMVVVEGDNGAEVRLFERAAKTNKFHVWSSKVKDVADLNQQISKAIIENRGVACVGEQTKALVTKGVSPQDLGSIPAPVNGRAAFAHAISGAKGFVRATIYLLC